LADLISRASRVMDNRTGHVRSEAASLLRELESLAASKEEELKESKLEINEHARQACCLRLRRTLLGQMFQPLLEGDFVAVQALQDRLPPY